MEWKIQYRTKGNVNIKTEIVDIHFDKKSDVKKWWLSKSSSFVDFTGNKTIGGFCQDNEFVNCSKVIIK